MVVNWGLPCFSFVAKTFKKIKNVLKDISARSWMVPLVWSLLEHLVGDGDCPSLRPNVT